MSFNPPRYLVVGTIVGLAVAIALAMGYWNIRPGSFSETVLVDDPTQPDFFMENSQITMLNPDGTVSYELTSRRATHLANEDSTRLEAPNLLYYRADEQQPWLVTSRTGWITEGGDRVQLNDDVLLKQEIPDEPVSQMTTSALTVFPSRDYAETDQDVRIEAVSGVTTATGMHVYFQDGRLQLLSNVRGLHEVR